VKLRNEKRLNWRTPLKVARWALLSGALSYAAFLALGLLHLIPALRALALGQCAVIFIELSAIACVTIQGWLWFLARRSPEPQVKPRQ
jgi:hypothetical protein